MARTPKPPKLRHSGLNVLQNLILRASAAFFGLVFVLPVAVTYLFDMTDLQPTFDDVLPWIIFGCCAGALFLLVTPEFWNVFLPSVGQRFSEIVESNEFTARFWESFKSGAVFRESLTLLAGLAVLGMVAFFIGFEFVVGMPIGKAPNQFAEWFINLVIASTLLLAFIIHTGAAFMAAKSAVSSETANGSEAGTQTPDYRDYFKAGTSQNDGDAQEDDFAFDPSAFSDLQHAEKPKQRKKANRSKDGKTESGHHPDDADLWEVVNDPASTAEERKTALEMVLDREAGRNAR